MSRGTRPAPLAEFACRSVLRLYPRSLRAQFGDEMTDFLRTRHRDAARRGLVARLRFWRGVLFDAAQSIWVEHAPAWSRALWYGPAAMRDDVRAAVRVLRHSPGTTTAVVLLMALSLGTATTAFSVVNAVLLRALPFADPARLVMVWESRPDRQIDRNAVAGHEFPEWTTRTRAFAGMAAMAFPGPMTLTGAGEPAALKTVRVSANFTQVLGVVPALGRTFTAEEDTPGKGQVVLLSDHIWRERFGGDAAIAGRTITLDGKPIQVAGVMPATFAFPTVIANQTPDIWMPIAEPIYLYRGRHYLFVIARLQSGVTIEQAQADMSRVTHDLATELGDLNRGHEANVVSLQTDLVRTSRTSVLLVFGAAACLLLIGCANVAGLLVARGVARRRELALRLALGASTATLLRQLFIEALMLATAGGALGVLGVIVAARAWPALVPHEVLALDRLPVDTTVLVAALAASIATGLLFGVAPALQATRVSMVEAIGRGGRAPAGRESRRARRVLVTAQIALTLMLVFAAGLVTRTLVALARVDPGFRSDGVLAMDVELPPFAYSTAIRQRQFFDDATARVAALPGVTSVSTTNAIPLGGAYSGIAVDIEGRPAPSNEERAAHYRVVGAGYFKTMAVRLIEGREFLASDARLAVPLLRWFPQQPQPAGFSQPQPAPVAIVNASMARLFWPGESPLGRRFTALFSPRITVVGVVDDTRNDSLRDAPVPEFYLSSAQEPASSMTLLIRTGGQPLDLAASVRSALRSLDADVPLAPATSMDAIVGRTLGLSRFTSVLVGTFALIALVLLIAGVFGLVAFTTTERLPEIGVRLALGAERGSIFAMLLRDALALAVIGLTLGICGGFLLSRWMSGELYGASPLDPISVAVAIVVVTAAVLAATWLPARRAAGTNAWDVLRSS